MGNNNLSPLLWFLIIVFVIAGLLGVILPALGTNASIVNPNIVGSSLFNFTYNQFGNGSLIGVLVPNDITGFIQGDIIAISYIPLLVLLPLIVIGVIALIWAISHIIT